jgi:uncharacterized protein
MPVIEDDGAIQHLLRSSRTIAVVGLSDKPYRDSFVVGRYVLSRGYTVYPIHPTIDSALGMKSYPNLGSVRALVDIFRRPDLVPPVVHKAIAIGARAVWLQLGVTHSNASSYAAEHGLEVVEDRCIMVEHRRPML